MAKIIGLQIENLRRITKVDFTPDGRALTIIGGENEQGKSSFLDAISILLGGKPVACDVPVRTGADKAVIKGTFLADSWDAFEGTMTVKRTITKAGTWSVEVSAKDGAIYKSPQAVIERIFGKSLDPSEFANADDRKRIEMLKALIGCDFTALDAAREEAYAERTIVNREVKRLESVLASLPHFPDAPEAEVPMAVSIKEPEEIKPELLSVSALNASLDDARRLNEKNRQARAEFQTVLDRIADARAGIKELEGHLRNLRASTAALVSEEEKMRPAVESLADIDEDSIRTKIAEAEATNRTAQEEADRKNREAREAAAAAAQVRAAEAQAIPSTKRSGQTGNMPKSRSPSRP